MAESTNPGWLAQAWDEDHGKPFALPRSDLLTGLKVIAPAVTNSTNQLLWDLRDQGDQNFSAPLAAIAREQTAGRGQWGRSWQSHRGGLYLSLLLEVDLPVEHSHHLVLLSAWGIAYALQHHGIPVKLKWPNDLLLKGKKLGGIKTEIKIRQGKIITAAIGVGINWANPVPETGIGLERFCRDQLTQSLANLTDLAEVTLAGLTLGWQRYQNKGIDDLLKAYLEFFAHGGQEIKLPQGRGIIQSVTTQGELVVKLGDQQMVIPPGKISLGYGES